MDTINFKVNLFSFGCPECDKESRSLTGVARHFEKYHGKLITYKVRQEFEKDPLWPIKGVKV